MKWWTDLRKHLIPTEIEYMHQRQSRDRRGYQKVCYFIKEIPIVVNIGGLLSYILAGASYKSQHIQSRGSFHHYFRLSKIKE